MANIDDSKVALVIAIFLDFLQQPLAEQLAWAALFLFAFAAVYLYYTPASHHAAILAFTLRIVDKATPSLISCAFLLFGHVLWLPLLVLFWFLAFLAGTKNFLLAPSQAVCKHVKSLDLLNSARPATDPKDLEALCQENSSFDVRLAASLASLHSQIDSLQEDKSSLQAQVRVHTFFDTTIRNEELTAEVRGLKWSKQEMFMDTAKLKGEIYLLKQADEKKVEIVESCDEENTHTPRVGSYTTTLTKTETIVVTSISTSTSTSSSSSTQTSSTSTSTSTQTDLAPEPQQLTAPPPAPAPMTFTFSAAPVPTTPAAAPAAVPCPLCQEDSDAGYYHCA
jgi:hypothetical protein